MPACPNRRRVAHRFFPRLVEGFLAKKDARWFVLIIGLVLPMSGRPQSDVDQVIRAASARLPAKGHAVWDVEHWRPANREFDKQEVLARARAIAESQGMPEPQKAAYMEVQAKLADRHTRDLNVHSKTEVIWDKNRILAKQTFDKIAGQKLRVPTVRKSFYVGKDVVLLDDIYDPKTNQPASVHTYVEPRSVTSEHQDVFNSFPDRCVFCAGPIKQLFKDGVLPSPTLDGDSIVFASNYKADKTGSWPGLTVRISKSLGTMESVDVRDAHNYRFLRYTLTWDKERSSLPKKIYKEFIRPDGKVIISATWTLENFTVDGDSFKELDSVLHTGQPISDARFGSATSVDYMLRGSTLPTDERVQKLIAQGKREMAQKKQETDRDRRNWIFGIAVFIGTCSYVIYRRVFRRSRPSPPPAE